MEEGCVVCATSNRAPWELSASGLHEDLFAHFLTSLQNACRPIHLTSEHDYRRLLFSESQVSRPPCSSRDLLIVISRPVCNSCVPHLIIDCFGVGAKDM